jgi:hypothetical protein
VTDPCGDAQQSNVALPTSTATLLRPAHHRPVVVPIMVFGFTALLAAIGISRLEPPVERPKPQPQIDVADTPQPKERNEPTVIDTPTAEPPAANTPTAEPVRSLVLDTAQSYFATGTLPVSKMPSAKTSK